MTQAFPALMRTLKAAPLSWKAAPLWRMRSSPMLAVHHIDGNKWNLLPWNVAALPQRCNREMQSNGRLTSSKPTLQASTLNGYGHMCKRTTCGRKTKDPTTCPDLVLPSLAEEAPTFRIIRMNSSLGQGKDGEEEAPSGRGKIMGLTVCIPVCEGPRQ